jgi:PAS domain-containing protein
VAAEADRLDSLVAALYERLARIDDLGQASAAVLETLAHAIRLPDAVLVLKAEAGVNGAVWGLPHESTRFIVRAVADGALLERIMATAAPPAVYPAGSFPPLDFGSYVAVAVPGLRPRPALGALIVEGDVVDATLERVAALLRRMGPALARVAQIEALSAGDRRLSRQVDLLTTIVNALPDPVLITNEANDILLANVRAERLFTVGQEDSEGRRRAIQINNLLFSSFLTQSMIDAGMEGPRELNLVDTFEGSDLLFEVLSVPLPAVAGHSGVISVLRDITDLRTPSASSRSRSTARAWPSTRRGRSATG